MKLFIKNRTMNDNIDLKILSEKLIELIDVSIQALKKYINTPTNTQFNIQSSTDGNIIGVCGVLYGDNIIHVFRCKDNSIKEGFYFEDSLFSLFNIDYQGSELSMSRELYKKLRDDKNRFEFLESIDITDCKNIIYWEYNKLIDDYTDEEGIPDICDIFYYEDYMNDIIIPKYKNYE